MRTLIVSSALFASLVSVEARAQDIELTGPLTADSNWQDVEVDDDPEHLQLVAGLSAIDRSTTGTGAIGGLDNGFAGGASIDARLYFEFEGCDCFQHGPTLGVGASAAAHDEDEPSIRQYGIDLGYSGRFELRCMRDEETNRRFYASAIAGLSGLFSDAKEQREQDRAIADRFDHTSIGWRLGATFDVSFDGIILGLGLDLRTLYGIDTSLDRDFTLGATLRVGGELEL